MKNAPLVTALVVLGVALGGTTQSVAAQGHAPIAGGWIVTSWTNADGEVNSEPERGLFIFSESGNYSMMYVGGSEPREQYEDGQSDEEVIAAYRSFTANSGRYRVEGNKLTYEAYMAKDPNYMSGFMQDDGNGITLEFSLDDGVLTLVWPEDNRGGRKATLRRPGGA